ncbi:HK97 gp10 family phage protein [Paracoccus stylophorae]|uniref:HK97 gp10 family phage protein n=1 Tax=Paracoccus stylophorae TaxID=659350 RepID=A0ABY7ST31_9RHOB|nr:HK97 gp10 family phage protein [Paracoccus stylophorae]WCR09582.1 HK97 gp10 family phage protein [Paracoccus stylophorae]
MSITRRSSDALARRLAALPAEIVAKVQPAIQKSVNEIAADAKTLAEASRDDGDLIRSIEATGPGQTTPAYGTDGRRKLHDLQGAVTAGAPDVRHAHLIEFGTDPHVNGGLFAGTQHPGTDPQPFLLPSWRLNRARVQRRINRAIRKAIKEASA